MCRAWWAANCFESMLFSQTMQGLKLLTILRSCPQICLFIWLLVCFFLRGMLTNYLCQVWIQLKTISYRAIFYIQMAKKRKWPWTWLSLNHEERRQKNGLASGQGQSGYCHDFDEIASPRTNDQRNCCNLDWGWFQLTRTYTAFGHAFPCAHWAPKVFFPLMEKCSLTDPRTKSFEALLDV